jgi:5-methylthioadenosine/S-adenosylhomocysteine deaminase
MSVGVLAMPEAVDLLVGADFLYAMTADGAIATDAEVAVRDGRIVHAGPARPPGSWLPARIIDGGGRAVLPGFVNCHSHAASAIFRSQSDDGEGGRALYKVAFRGEREVTPQEWRDLAFLGAADMIKAGITTINDIWYEPEALAQACMDMGLRADIAFKIFDVKLEELWRGDYTRHGEIGESRLRRGVEFAQGWHGKGGGLISARIGPHASDTCSPDLHRAAVVEARRLGIGSHTHVAQSPAEVAMMEAAHGCGPAEFLRDLGCLGPDIYPRRGVYPDIPAISQRTIPWGIATDWMMNDPFEAMRNALNALRLRAGRHDAFTSEEALWRATAGAASVLGKAGEIGQLKPGMRADLIVIDLEQPHLQPFYGDFASIVWYARAADVVTSVIGGRVVMEDRRIARIDEAGVLARIAAHRQRWGDMMLALGGVSRLAPCCG